MGCADCELKVVNMKMVAQASTGKSLIMEYTYGQCAWLIDSSNITSSTPESFTKTLHSKQNVLWQYISRDHTSVAAANHRTDW